MVQSHTAGRGRVLSSDSHMQLVVLTRAVSLFWAHAVFYPALCELPGLQGEQDIRDPGLMELAM